MAHVNPQFRTDENGVLIPLNKDAEESLQNMTRPRKDVLRLAGFKESAPGGGRWVHTPVDTNDLEHKRRQQDSYRALGMSAEEAKLASELD
jgi:hypothetical protein